MNLGHEKYNEISKKKEYEIQLGEMLITRFGLGTKTTWTSIERFQSLLVIVPLSTPPYTHS